MNSRTFFAGIEGCTTKMSGYCTTCETGAKSLIGSKGSDLYSVWLMAWVPMVAMRIV